MQPDSNWLNQIDDTTSAFKAVCSNLTHDELNWKPAADKWSIGQNIEHLIIINESYRPVIEACRSGSYKLPLWGKLNFIVAFLGKTILKSVQPDRVRKMKTFPIWKPSESNISEDILLRFSRHQEELKKLITASADLIEKDIIISSPANVNIVYRLRTAFDIIVTHEQRHLKQVREVKAAMDYN